MFKIAECHLQFSRAIDPVQEDTLGSHVAVQEADPMDGV